MSWEDNFEDQRKRFSKAGIDLRQLTDQGVLEEGEVNVQTTDY